MGHLFRSLIVADALVAAGRRCRFYLNENGRALEIVSRRGHCAEIVPLHAAVDWESGVIERHGLRVWIDDRFSTDRIHAARVKALGLPLVTFDDYGSGSELADLHVAGLMLDPADEVRGRRVLRGLDYIVLDPAIERFRRLRTERGSTAVTLGGSDTYGVTVRVVETLASARCPATVVLGPCFEHHAELAAVVTPQITVKNTVPSLIEEFSRHDFAITGGGITALEAAASGVPSVVVANETFEIPLGLALERAGASRFAGHHSRLDLDLLTADLPVAEMSRNCLNAVSLDGTKRVIGALTSL